MKRLSLRDAVSLSLLVLASLASLSALAATPGDADRNAERAAIAAERREVLVAFDARQRDCRSRFVVSSCINEATETRRLALARLRARELALGDAQRRETAAVREAAIAAKAASAPRAVEAASAPRHVAPRAPNVPNPPAIGRAGPAEMGPQAAAEAAAKRRAREQENEAAFAAKQQAAAEHRDAVLKRNTARAAKGKAVAPLPVPSAASTP